MPSTLVDSLRASRNVETACGCFFGANLISGVFAEKGGTGTFEMAGSNQINFCWSSASTDSGSKSAGAVVSCHELAKK